MRAGLDLREGICVIRGPRVWLEMEKHETQQASKQASKQVTGLVDARSLSKRTA